MAGGIFERVKEMSDERFDNTDSFKDNHTENPADSDRNDTYHDQVSEHGLSGSENTNSENAYSGYYGGYSFNANTRDDTGYSGSDYSSAANSSDSFERDGSADRPEYEQSAASAESSSPENGRYYSYNRAQTAGGSSRENRSSSPSPDYSRIKKRKKGHSRLAVVLAVILVFVIGAGAGALATGRASSASLSKNSSSAQSQVESSVKEDKEEAEDSSAETEPSSQSRSGGSTISTVEDEMKDSSLSDTTVADVAEKVMPAIVSVYNKFTEESEFFGRKYTQEGESAGSGIIIEETDNELLIVTNNHVVEGADSLSVQFIDESNCEASLKGTDASSDLAVIAVSLDSLSEETKKQIAIAELGDSDSLRIGEHAIAIGNALGYGQSLTVGYISALNREITGEDGITGTFIQTDAAINPGNSGGALLNSRGQVIGINSNKIGGSTIEGMGFAIPISKAEPIIDSLKTQESKTKVAEEEQGVLGIYGISVTSDVASAYGLPVGAYVEEIIEGTGAAQSKLVHGDIITGINGQSISGMEDLQNQLIYYSAGEEVTLTVQHPMEGSEYEEREIKVTLSKRSDVSSSSSDSSDRQEPGQDSRPSQEEGDSGFFSFPFGF